MTARQDAPLLFCRLQADLQHGTTVHSSLASREQLLGQAQLLMCCVPCRTWGSGASRTRCITCFMSYQRMHKLPTSQVLVAVRVQVHQQVHTSKLCCVGWDSCAIPNARHFAVIPMLCEVSKACHATHLWPWPTVHSYGRNHIPTCSRIISLWTSGNYPQRQLSPANCNVAGRHFLRCAVHSRCSSAKSRCGSCCAYDSAACASSCCPIVSLLRWLATIALMVSRLNSGCPAVCTMR